MIQIKSDVLDKIILHARKALTNDACGYLVGEENLILWSYEMTNVDTRPEHFSFDPTEQYKLYSELRKLGLTFMANYHIHPSTATRPSRIDIRLAYNTDVSYVIGSLTEEVPVVTSYKRTNGLLETEEIKIIN